MSLKEKQKQYSEKAFEKIEKYDYENEYYHHFFRQIPFYKVQKILERNQLSLEGQKVFVASCGSGIDLHYLKKFYNAKYFVSDIAQNSVDYVIKNFPDVEGQVEDNEALSFPDNHFDFSFVAASLHHLPRPIVGLYELLRVAKKGLIVIEPNDSFLTRIATQLKLATEYEPSGNYVYRISKHDVERITKAHFLKCDVIRFFATHRIAKSDKEFAFLKFLNNAANATIPMQGNYIVFLIKK